MIIGVAGPYSASTDEERQRNLDSMNEAAVLLFKKGHIPFIGVNTALPIAEKLGEPERYEAIMKISLQLIDKCDALLLIGESPGANRERDLIIAKGLPVYYHLNDVPG